MSEFQSSESAINNNSHETIIPVISEVEIENAIQNKDLIKNAYIQLHTDTDASAKIPKDVLYNPEYQFGVLDIETANTPCIKEPQIIIISLDISASMSELCKDRRTQMDHAIHTAKNVISAIAKIEDSNVSIIVYAFDDFVDKIIPITKITQDNVSNLESMLDNCKPRGSTNIEKALKNAQTVISTLKITDPLCHITHIFLTDGQATAGESNSHVLSNYVDSSIRNTFVGYGINHSSALLERLSSHKTGAYVFVDAIENTGLVFGDIVYGILYTAIVDITIESENCELYNFEEDTWSTRLELPYLLSESRKTFHIRSKTPSSLNVKIYGKNALIEASTENEDVFEDVGGVMPDLEDSFTNLDKYMFRQRTLELLFKAKQVRNSSHSVTEMKKELDTFLNIMREYMNQHDLKSDPFYQTLCEDINITSKTILADTNTFEMYSNARQHSQGRQGSYNVSLPPTQTQPMHNNLPPCGFLRRQNCNVSYMDNDNDTYQESYNEDDDQDQTQPLDITPAPINRSYTSERQRTIMREVSQI
jgi:hypothetical protein